MLVGEGCGWSCVSSSVVCGCFFLFLYLRYRYTLEVQLSVVRSCFFHRRSVLPKVVGDGYVSRLLWCVVAPFAPFFSIFGTITFLRYFQVLLGPILNTNVALSSVYSLV